MVSFSCEACGETVPKKKCSQHQRRCRDACFTCLDCQKTFYGNEYVNHTSCISEAEKYEKKFYKGNKKNNKKNKNKNVELKREDMEETDSSSKQSKKEKIHNNKHKVDDKGKKESRNHIDLSEFVVKDKPTSLYKVFKKLHGKKDKLSKKLAENKKSFLRSLKVTEKEDGTLVLSIA